MILQDKKNEILKKFVDICNELNIWYSMDEKSLLLLFSNKDFINNLDCHSVMMTLDGYETLKANYSNNVLDNINNSEYRALQCKFVENNSDIYSDQPFININLLIPTKIDKLRKVINFKNRYLSSLNNILSYKDTNILGIKTKLFFNKLLKRHFSPLTFKSLYNEIYDEHFEGYIVTKNIINKTLYSKWIPNLSFKTLEKDLNDLPLKIIYEYETYLKNMYGENYPSYIVKESNIRHINPIELWDISKINNSKPTTKEDTKEILVSKEIKEDINSQE